MVESPGSRIDQEPVEIEDVLQSEVDRLDLARLSSAMPLSPGGVRVVVSQNLKRLAVIGCHASADIADALADLLGRHDSQLSSRHLLDEHPG
jgi:hypothetical protein